jgi:lysophospholipase L1-like esterase
MKNLRVVFFGDSICVGQHVSVHRTWVAQISARLEALGRELGTKVVVTNPSTSGRTTRQALELMTYEVLAQPVDLLVVQYGMNDCNYWQDGRGVPRVSEAAFVANLAEILQRAQQYKVQRLLVNTNHPTTRTQVTMPHVDITYEASNRRYNELIRRVAAENNVACVDVEAFFHQHTDNNPASLEELLLPAPDLLHLSEAGHDLYFSIVYPQVEQAIREMIAAAG